MLNTEPRIFLNAFNMDVAVPKDSCTTFMALLMKLPINKHKPKVVNVIHTVKGNHHLGKKCVTMIITRLLMEKIHNPRH